MTLTDRASTQIKAFLAETDQPADGLRVRVVGGGCSGLQYKVGLDAEKRGDKIFEHEGAKLLVDRRSYLYLNGTCVNWSDDLTGSGFRFENPNVKQSCGCGESFVV